MSLDKIWKQQLTLVSYGNQYLSGQIAMQQWQQHQIFDLHQFLFRDLSSQHLLAQHFQVWLEGLKQQGVQRISLHHSSILQQEQNPNTNVELLSFAHFIVSHHGHKMTAWIFGQELAEWYSAEDDFVIPAAQCSPARIMTYWRFELHNKLCKLIQQDLIQPNWDEIQQFTDAELFNHHYAQGFNKPDTHNALYYGQTLNQDSSLDASQPQANLLALLPQQTPAPYAHQMLYQLEALTQFIQTKINHPYRADGIIFTPEEQLNLRHFSEKIDELTAKFLVKVANHYTSAKLTPPAPLSTPFSTTGTTLNSPPQLPKSSHSQHAGSKKISVLTLIIVTALVCFMAFYFGI